MIGAIRGSLVVASFAAVVGGVWLLSPAWAMITGGGIILADFLGETIFDKLTRSRKDD